MEGYQYQFFLEGYMFLNLNIVVDLFILFCLFITIVNKLAKWKHGTRNAVRTRNV